MRPGSGSLGWLVHPLGLGRDPGLRVRPRDIQAGGAHGHQDPHAHVVVAEGLAREPSLTEQIPALEHLELRPGHLLGLALQILDAAGGALGVRAAAVEDVHVYVDRPAGKEDSDLDDLGETLRGLDHVSDVRVDVSGNAVAVSYEGGKEGREAIERAVEEAGYAVSRLSVRSDFEEGQGRGLWDI